MNRFIVLSFVIALALNGAFFAVAAARKTDVVTDLSYSLTFALLAVVLPFTGAREPVQLVASLLVVVWAVRLGAYLFRRILRMKIDHRFDEMRDEPLRFARFWLLQAVAVAVIMLPVSYLLDRGAAPGRRLPLGARGRGRARELDQRRHRRLHGLPRHVTARAGAGG